MGKNNVGQFILKENAEAKRNPRFVVWIIATNKKIGDPWTFSEYTSWITKHLQNFKKLHSLEESQPIDLLKNGQEQFTSFLEQVGA